MNHCLYLVTRAGSVEAPGRLVNLRPGLHAPPAGLGVALDDKAMPAGIKKLTRSGLSVVGALSGPGALGAAARQDARELGAPSVKKAKGFPVMGEK